MKQQDCIETLQRVPRLPVESSALGGLWLTWFADRLQALPEAMIVWRERSRQRRQLAAMDDHMLRDIGVSRTPAWAETEKWFWQP